MITKEQAMTGRNFIQTHYYDNEVVYGSFGYQRITNDNVLPLDKPIKWRANGKCKTWKKESNKHRFSLPIKHGLYNFSYINDEKCPFIRISGLIY